MKPSLKIFQASQWALGLSLLLAPSVFASGWQAYDAGTFQKAQQDGKTVILDFKAPWCSTCRTQAPILESLLEEEALKNVIGFKVDYDSSSSLKKQLGVRKQSTLIVFKGQVEKARSIGQTRKASLREMISQGL